MRAKNLHQKVIPLSRDNPRDSGKNLFSPRRKVREKVAKGKQASLGAGGPRSSGQSVHESVSRPCWGAVERVREPDWETVEAEKENTGQGAAHPLGKVLGFVQVVWAMADERPADKPINKITRIVMQR
jgi:hypothetical protein